MKWDPPGHPYPPLGLPVPPCLTGHPQPLHTCSPGQHFPAPAASPLSQNPVGRRSQRHSRAWLTPGGSCPTGPLAGGSRHRQSADTLMRVPSQQIHARRARHLGGERRRGPTAANPLRTLEETRMGPLRPLPPPCWPHAPPPPTHSTQALKRDPHPRARGATGLLARHSLQSPPVPTGTRTRTSSSSPFSSVTCHRGRMLRWPPQPHFWL